MIDLKPEEMSLDEWTGLNEYPIFESDYREGLNKKIRDHFMFQEIGHETVEQFRFSMRRKMNEIMPLYNQLYETTRLQFDPLSTVDITTVTNAEQSQQSSGSNVNETTGDVDSTAKNVSSTFPQVMLGGNKDYATSGADSNSKSKTTGKTEDVSTAENDATQSSSSNTKGYQGSASQLLQQYRAAILNVDVLVIRELDELFMMVWNTGDEYSATKGRYFF